MKRKRAIFTIVTCSIAVVLLTCVLAVGLQSKGFGFWDEAEALDAGEAGAHEHTVEYDPAEYTVQDIYIDWECGPVEISAGDGAMVEVTETSSQPLDVSNSMQVTLGEGNLRVKWNKDRFRFHLFGWFGDQQGKALRIQLPREVAAQLAEVEASNISGDMSLSGLAGKYLDLSSVSGSLSLTGIHLSGSCALSTTSGDITAQGLEAMDLELDSTSGSFRLTDVQAKRHVGCDTISGETSFTGSAAEGFHANSVSGPVYADLAACPQELSIDSVSGSLTVELPANACFSADYETLSGAFRCDFPSTGMGEEGAVYGSGPAAGSLRFATTSGDITVKKAA